MVHLFAILGGFAVILLVLQDVFEVLLLPRKVARRRRLVSTVLRPTWRAWRRVAAVLGAETRPVFLSCYGPLAVVILYVFWAACLIAAYGLCEWGLNSFSPHPIPFKASLYLSGSTFFTLGFGDVVPHSGPAKILAVAEAANGFGLVAAVIGYLPVLYQSFSNREAHVIQLDARAGSPPSAGFLLSQHGSADAMPELMEFLRYCENWTASLLEGHLSFPVLAFYRSHHDNQSWLAGLCAVMDACAVLLTGIEGVNGFQPRMTFAMGRMAVLEMMNILRLAPMEVPVDRLSAAQFEYLTASLNNAGMRWRDADAEQRLAQFRSTYEPYLCAISQYLMQPLPGWSPTGAPDNWQSGEDVRLIKALTDVGEVRE